MRVLPSTAYCMNIDYRTDRRKQVIKDFQRLQNVADINIERISAVENTQRPALGVAQTFKRIIKNAKDNNLEHVLIIEDDLFVIDAQKVINSLNNVPEDWDILLGGVYHYVPDKKYNQYWMRVKDFCSLHFIIIRDRIYDKVLAIDSRVKHMDRLLGAEVKKSVFNAYLMHPMLCQQRPGFSNIRKKPVNDNRHGLPWTIHPDTITTLKK